MGIDILQVITFSLLQLFAPSSFALDLIHEFPEIV